MKHVLFIVLIIMVLTNVSRCGPVKTVTGAVSDFSDTVTQHVEYLEESGSSVGE